MDANLNEKDRILDLKKMASNNKSSKETGNMEYINCNRFYFEDY